MVNYYIFCKYSWRCCSLKKKLMKRNYQDRSSKGIWQEISIIPPFFHFWTEFMNRIEPNRNREATCLLNCEKIRFKSENFGTDYLCTFSQNFHSNSKFFGKMVCLTYNANFDSLLHSNHKMSQDCTRGGDHHSNPSNYQIQRNSNKGLNMFKFFFKFPSWNFSNLFFDHKWNSIIGKRLPSHPAPSSFGSINKNSQRNYPIHFTIRANDFLLNYKAIDFHEEYFSW